MPIDYPYGKRLIYLPESVIFLWKIPIPADFSLYQPCVLLDGLFNPLRLDADIALRRGCAAVL